MTTIIAAIVIAAAVFAGGCWFIVYLNDEDYSDD